MNTNAVVATLQTYEPDLRRCGVIGLALFGSTARGVASEDSDIDIAVRLTPGTRGFPHLRRLGELKRMLAEMLGRDVDVIAEPAASARVQSEIDRDRVDAF